MRSADGTGARPFRFFRLRFDGHLNGVLPTIFLCPTRVDLTLLKIMVCGRWPRVQASPRSRDFRAALRPALGSFPIAAAEVVGSQIGVAGAALANIVGGDENAVDNGDQGALATSTGAEALVLRAVVRGLGPRSAPGRLAPSATQS